MEPVEIGYYPPDWCLHSGEERLQNGLLRHFDPCEPPWQVGDVLCFRYGRAAAHCALYVGEGMIVHARSGHCVRMDELDMPALASRLVGGYRLREARQCKQ
mgnify:FL=1